MSLTTTIAANLFLDAAALAALAVVCRIPFGLRGSRAPENVVVLPVASAPERDRAA